MNLLKIAKTVNRHRTAAISLIVFVTCWSIWLPYLVPIFRVRVYDTHLILTPDQAPRLQFSTYTVKYLPCQYLRGSVFISASGLGIVPVILKNLYNDAPFGSGALKGIEYHTDFPLWTELETQLYVDLPPAYKDFSVDQMKMIGDFVYSCNSLHIEYHKRVDFTLNQ